MSRLSIIKNDTYLEPFECKLTERKEEIISKEKQLIGESANLSDFAQGHKYFGLHKINNEWIFREWAPNATNIYLVGDCSNWEILSDFKFKPSAKGEWQLKIPIEQLKSGEKYKLWMEWDGGADYRIPLYANYVIQDAETKLFDAAVWKPENQFPWLNNKPGPLNNKPLLIY